MTNEIIAIFPLPIYKTNIERDFTKQEHDELDAIIRGGQLVKTNGEAQIGSYEKNVSLDKYLLNRKAFFNFRSFIEHHLKEYATTIGIDMKETSWSPYITQSWLNVYKPNNFDGFHDHQNCIMSGVFYINSLKNLAHGQRDGILFDSTSHHMLEKLSLTEREAKDTMFSDKPVHVPTVTGDLIIFPSSTYHSVSLNETSNQHRISLAFNVI